MQPLTVLFAELHRKLLLSVVVLKLILIIKHFPQNILLTKCLGRVNLKLVFKVITDPWPNSFQGLFQKYVLCSSLFKKICNKSKLFHKKVVNKC